MANLSRCVRHHALRNPQRVALSYEGAHITYAVLWGRICALTRFLRARGVRQGDRVALFMKNSPAFLEIAFAASHVGAVLVPINFRLANDEVDYILQDSGAVLLFRDAELASWDAAVPDVVTVTPEVQRDASLLAAESGDEFL